MRWVVLVVAIIMLPVVANAEWFGPKDSANYNAAAIGDSICYAQAWRIPHTGTADSAQLGFKYRYTAIAYALIYSDNGGEPGALLARSVDSVGGDNLTIVDFSGETLSEDSVYWIGVEVLYEGGSSVRLYPSKDTARTQEYYHHGGPHQDPWPTGSDTYASDYYMPYIRIFYTPAAAYDTITVETTFSLTAATYFHEKFTPPPAAYHGSETYFTIGMDNGAIAARYTGIVGADSATEDAISSWFHDDIEYLHYCSLLTWFTAYNGLTTSDTMYWYAVKSDSSGTLARRWTEDSASWFRRRANSNWNANGLANNDDRWSSILRKWVYDDYDGGSCYRFGGDSSSYNNILRWADSLSWGREFRGYYAQPKATFAKNDYVRIASDDNATSSERPVLKVAGYRISPSPTSTSGNRHSSQRHGKPNRHGG